MEKNKLPQENKSGFKIPDAYFEELPELLTDSLFNKHSKNLLEENIPSGFKTPSNYLKDFEVAFPEKETNTRVISIFSKRILYYTAAVAAIFLLVFNTLFQKKNTDVSWDSLELSAIENYIEDGYLDIPQAEITNYLYEDGYVIEDADFSNVNSNAVMDYLNEHVEDPTYIFER